MAETIPAPAETPTTLEIFRHDDNPVVFPAGKVIFQRGDHRDYMYVVISGEVEVRIGDILIETLGPGEIFGEMALVDPGHKRVATTVAKTEVACARVDDRRFHFLVEQTPNFAITVMRVLVKRIRRMNEMVAAAALGG